MSTVPTAYIDRLPNEILRMICLFVNEPDDDDECYGGRVFLPKRHPRGRGWVASILVLRWVSRRLRLIVDDLDIWGQDDFDLTSQFWPPENGTPFEFARIINNFLRDERLVYAISPRSVWEFTSIEVFFTILFNVPEMPLNTREIDLLDFEVGLGSAVHHLKRFTCVTDLSICVTSEATKAERLVDLDAIVRSCPLLQSLDLRMLENYRGTLLNAANLRHLSLEFCDHFQRITSDLIPLKSAKTLTSFSIEHRDHYMDEFPGHALFEPFASLTEFTANCLTDKFCDILVNGKFLLSDLGVCLRVAYMDGSSFQKVREVFFASSLEHLHILDFTVEYDAAGRGENERDLDEMEPIIYAITGLRHLTYLRIRAGLRLSWCDRFARLRNLKYFYYSIIDTGN